MAAAVADEAAHQRRCLRQEEAQLAQLTGPSPPDAATRVVEITSSAIAVRALAEDGAVVVATGGAPGAAWGVFCGWGSVGSPLFCRYST